VDFWERKRGAGERGQKRAQEWFFGVMRAQGWSIGADWLNAEDAESTEEEGAVWGECHASGGSAQASPPRAAAKLVARVGGCCVPVGKFKLCHPPIFRQYEKNSQSFESCLAPFALHVLQHTSMLSCLAEI
jgi:hypothetical protein